MALTATATTGFERVGLTSADRVFYLPGDPGVTFAKGQQVAITNGVISDAGDSAKPIGICAEATVVPAATTAAATAAQINKIEDASADLCVVPVLLNVASGWPIYKVTFANHFDDTLAAYTVGTPSLTLTTSPGANDDTNGAIIYVYEGPGRGEILIGDDYVHATKILTVHRRASATLTSSTKVIILEGEGGSAGGIPFLGRMDADTNIAVDASDGYDDGDWMLYFDLIEAPSLLHNLTVKVIPRVAFYD
jgi:uncharacterized phage protein gp47/JayE